MLKSKLSFGVRLFVGFTLMSLLMLGVMDSVFAEPLKGKTGSSLRWCSGWLDLDVITSFKQGDKLKIKVGGSANDIIIRFLSKGDNPNDPVGIDGGIIRVPKTRIIEITLTEEHKDVVQISAHGGPNPWNLYRMPGGNGCETTILNVERLGQQ